VERVKRANEKINYLEELNSNWDSYGAVPPNSTAIENAKDVVWRLGIKPSVIAPHPDEGITLTFVQKPTKSVSVECENTGEIIGITHKETNESDIWELNIKDMDKDVKKIREYLLTEKP